MWILVISVLLFSISLVMVSPLLPTYRSELEVANKENAELKAERDTLVAEIKDLKAEIAENTQQAEALRKQLSHVEKLEKELENLRTQVAESKKRPQVREKSSVGTAPLYKVVRKAPLYRNPTEKSEVLMHLGQGYTVRSAGIVFERWLKVIYSHSNPPGYIQREDVVLVSR